MEKPAEKADRGKPKKRKQEEQHFVEIRPERRKEQQEAQRPQHLEEPRLPKRIRYQAVCCIHMVYCALSTVFVSLKVNLHLFLFRNNGQSVSEDHRQRNEERGLVKEHRMRPYPFLLPLQLPWLLASPSTSGCRNCCHRTRHLPGPYLTSYRLPAAARWRLSSSCAESHRGLRKKRGSYLE